jgi:serine phosphatase RsbU (regulator of sigma subunit)
MNDQRKRYAALVAGVVGAYYGSAKLGLGLAFESSSVTAIWPPTGIALAALVLGGRRLWPAVALGAFLANLGTGPPLYAIAGITAGNTLEAVVGAWLLCRADFRPRLDRARDVVALVVLAGVVSTAVSATIGVGSLLAAGEIDVSDVDTLWRTWWSGDMGGDLIAAPVIMVAITHWPYRDAPGRPLEALAVALVLGGVAGVAFSAGAGLAYLIFPPLIWASLRFWQPGAVAATLLVAAVAVPLAEQDVGPFSGHSPDERLLLAQTFVATVAISALLLAAITTERRRSEHDVEHIADTLQQSLLPARVPRIPGLETAIEFRPAGSRHLVGGDFYDLFANDDGSFGVVVGDVCGKGADAAAVTALARYTLRAAAIQETEPARILGLLNGALLRQRSRGEFCTVAYARLERNGAGARLRLTTAGHPLPLVLRADGRVEPVGRPGTLLGVTRSPDLPEATVELAPGEALFLYTDGLTDAYAPRRVVTMPDLTAILERCAGLDATSIVAGVESSLLALDGVEPRDDIALVVLRVPEAIPGIERRVDLRLEPDVGATPVARAALDDVKFALEGEAFENLRLLVTELVTNSMRHADSPEVLLTVEVLPGSVNVAVSDRGDGFRPEPRTEESDAASGWGLYLVEQLSDRWGVERGAATRVWFEIDRA